AGAKLLRRLSCRRGGCHHKATCILTRWHISECQSYFSFDYQQKWPRTIIWSQIFVDCSPEPFPLQSVTAMRSHEQIWDEVSQHAKRMRSHELTPLPKLCGD